MPDDSQMDEIRIKTKELLDRVEKAPDGSFLLRVRSFVKFAQQQRETFSNTVSE